MANIIKIEKKDEKRDKFLESLGTHCIQENRFVFQDQEYLKTEIMKIIYKRKEPICKLLITAADMHILQYYGHHCVAATPPLKANLTSHLFIC